MSRGEFAEWDLPTWNRRLFDAVFSTSGTASLPVRRINVSPSFLAGIVGLSETSGDEVREALLARIRDGFPRGLGVFDRPRFLRSWQRDEEIPPFFVNLYLSLIAASASEETHREGNFRARMALFLGLSRRVNPVTYDLPRLWRDLEAWLHGDLAAGMGYRTLELPNPGNENIIGYAKRLAFPRFRDLTWLSRAITESGIDAESPVSEILQAVGRARPQFSQAFRAEFDRFRKLARSGEPACMNTLFWDAFTEVTWETHRSRSQSNRRCHLGMEVPEVWSPRAVLLVPRGFDASELPGRPTALDEQADFGQVVSASDGWAVLLRRDHPWRLALPKRLGTLIEAGCLPFGPGDATHWDARSSLPWSGPAWLLVSEARVISVRRALKGVGVGAVLTPIPTVGDWYLLGRLEYTRDSARGIVEGLPPELRNLLDPGVPDAQIYVRDAIRLPDGILALRPRLPLMWAEGADAIRLAPLDGAATIELLPGPDGLFSIPAEACRRLTPGDYRATAHAARRIQASRVLHLIQTYSGSDPPLSPSDAGRWLVEGSRGQLAPLTGQEPGRSEEIDSALLARARSPLPQVRGGVTSSWRTLGEIPPEWADLFEVLVAWSSRREGLGWDEVARLVRNGLQAREWSTQQAVDVLVDNEVVDRFYDRRWRGSLFYPRRLTGRLESTETGWELRVSGPTSRLWRHRFMDVLASHGLTAEVAVLGDGAGVGAMRVRGECRDDLAELLTEMAVERREPVEQPDPARVLSERVPASFSDGGVVSFFHPSRSTFVESRPKGDEGSVWRLERRTFESKQTAYVLLHGGQPRWISRSRRWGGFLFGLTESTPFWTVGEPGVVATRSPLPVTMARAALWHGGGVAGSGWREGSRTWWYSFASIGRAKSLLSPWLSHAETKSAPDPATALWVEALSEAPGAPMERSIRRWYGGEE